MPFSGENKGQEEHDALMSSDGPRLFPKACYSGALDQVTPQGR